MKFFFLSYAVISYVASVYLVRKINRDDAKDIGKSASEYVKSLDSGVVFSQLFVIGFSPLFFPILSYFYIVQYIEREAPDTFTNIKNITNTLIRKIL